MVLNNINDIISRLPKTDLHLHLAGSIRPATCLQLIQKNKIDSTLQTEQDVMEFMNYDNFSDFVSKYTFFSDLLVTPDDFGFITLELITDLVKDNVQYAEITISPYDHIRNGIDYREMMVSIDNAIKSGENNYNIKINLIIDLVRDYGPEISDKVLEETIRMKNPRVVSIGLGGNENAYPAREFASTFKKAAAAGLRLTAHAGETTSPESVWDVINYLHVHRIGHALKSSEDSQLIELLQDKRIPLEICVSSNVLTGAVRNIQSHPVKYFFDRRLLFSIGTDDPGMFNTNLSNEYGILNRSFNLMLGELRQIILNGIQIAFISDHEKHNLFRGFSEEFHQLRKLE